MFLHYKNYKKKLKLCRNFLIYKVLLRSFKPWHPINRWIWTRKRRSWSSVACTKFFARSCSGGWRRRWSRSCRTRWSTWSSATWSMLFRSSSTPTCRNTASSSPMEAKKVRNFYKKLLWKCFDCLWTQI